MKFRKLKKEEIEVRIGTVKDTYITLLLYKDARADMGILDECVGPENWQRKHYSVKDNMYCSVGIKIGDEWVWKDDCGTESFSEKEKGEASDSFKRACVNWGIGRELYTIREIYISCDIERNINGKLSPKYLTSFDVDYVDISDDMTIQAITISAYNKQTKRREQIYSMGKNNTQAVARVAPAVPATIEPIVEATKPKQKNLVLPIEPPYVEIPENPEITLAEATNLKTKDGTRLGDMDDADIYKIWNKMKDTEPSINKTAVQLIVGTMRKEWEKIKREIDENERELAEANRGTV